MVENHLTSQLLCHGKSERKVIRNQEERVQQPLPFILVWGTYLLVKQDSKGHGPPLSVTNIWVSVVVDWVSKEKKGLSWFSQIGKYDHTVKTQMLHSLLNQMSCKQVCLAPAETLLLVCLLDTICFGALHFPTRKCTLSQSLVKIQWGVPFHC